jgi:hypothetical protein
VRERRGDCDALGPVAAELALGTAEAGERGAALAHLDTCPTCRARVRELSEAVDQLLALAPEAEPPPGFESAVLDQIAVEAEQRSVRPARRPRVALLAAAAVVLVLGGVGIGLAANEDGVADAESLAEAPMATLSGERVGEVWRYGNDNAVVVVSVPAWAGDDSPSHDRYRLRLDLADGGTADLGPLELDDAGSSWASATGVEGDEIAGVSVVDDRGLVWCSGRFA